MKAYVTFAAISLLFSASAAGTPTTQPARTTTQPATTTAPAVDPAVRKILDAMEAAGKTTKTIRADLTYESYNRTMGDREYRTGWVAYQRKQAVKIGDKTITTPPMFRVHFETMKLGKGKTVTNIVDYAYDGKTLTIARAKTKTITRFQLPPGNKGADMMQLGQGPFPLPFGQKTADMVKYFVCTTRPAKTHEKDTVYLSLIPRKAHAKQLNTVSISMWVSTKNHLPVKIITSMKTKDDITSRFSKIRLNEAINKSFFAIPKPFGWKVIVEPFKAGQNIKP